MSAVIKWYQVCFLYFMLLSVVAVIAFQPSYAQQQRDNIDYDAIRAGGFNDVADVLQDMTPAQLHGVLNQAKDIQKDLEKMSPKERGELMQQLHGINSSLDYQKVNIRKLDPKKSKGLKGVRSDMREYKKRRGQ